MRSRIFNLDCKEGMGSLPDQSVNCCVTSPPYYGLRNYGVDGQIGLEATPEAYVQKLVEIFREVRRVLNNDGTLWLNLGDSYWGGKGVSSQAWSTSMVGKRETINGQQHQIATKGETRPTDRKHELIKPKDLIGIPWMVAFALRSDGWYLRQDIIWNKPNPMPESVTDRCIKAHEYVFLLSKSPRYYFDQQAIKKPIADSSVQRLSQDINNQNGSDRVPGKTNGRIKAVSWKGSLFDSGKTGEMQLTRGGKNMKCVRPYGIVRDRLLDYDSKEKILRNNTTRGIYNHECEIPSPDIMANKRSVWTVTTKPFKEAHFATFPEDLIVDCIKAGYPEGGIVLDPFMGAGTTALVASKLGRRYLGYELNPEYIAIAENRLYTELGLFNESSL